jgi:hypothetical protein
LALQEAARACSFALARVGISMAIKRAMIEITTNNSINVNPLDLFIFFNLESKNILHGSSYGKRTLFINIHEKLPKSKLY